MHQESTVHIQEDEVVETSLAKLILTLCEFSEEPDEIFELASELVKSGKIRITLDSYEDIVESSRCRPSLQWAH